MTRLVTKVVGARHHLLAPATLAKMRAGDPVELRREPQNVHDPNAVSVWKDDRKLGYVPAVDSPAVAKVMDEGLLRSATIHLAQPNLLITWAKPGEPEPNDEGWDFLE